MLIGFFLCFSVSNLLTVRQRKKIFLNFLKYIQGHHLKKSRHVAYTNIFSKKLKPKIIQRFCEKGQLIDVQF
jgi:predicted transcriptional regulator